MAGTVVLQNEEIQEILTAKESYAYFGSEVSSSLVDDLLAIHGQASHQSKESLDAVCTLIAAGRTTAPTRILKAALEEAASCLNSMPNVSSDEIEKLAESIETYYNELETGKVELIVEASDKAFTNKLFTGDITVAGNATIKGNEHVYGHLTVNSDETVLGNLTVGQNETIGGNLTVNGQIISGNFASNLTISGNPQQACIIFQDANGNEKARICSSVIPGDKGVFVSVDGGVTQNLRVANGGNTIITPEATSAAVALTVNGVTGATAAQITANDQTQLALNVTGTGAFNDIVLPAAITQASTSASPGLIELGGADASTSNVSIFEVTASGQGRNIFVGNYQTVPGNPLSSAADNVAIGTHALQLLTTGTSNVAIGPNTSIGLQTANNTVAIGNFASTQGANDSIAIGNSAITIGAARSIVFGSKDSSNAIGSAPIANAVNEIVIGSASGTGSGAIGSGIASISIGGSDGTLNGAFAGAFDAIAIGVGASAGATNAVALGTNATVAQSNAIILGSVGNAAVAVGIGTNTPSAKLHVVGVAGTPVARFDAGNNLTASQIFFSNVEASGAAANGLQLSAPGTGNLQYFSSTRKIKKNIRAMRNESEVLYQLNPVVYDCKTGSETNIPGFIAEDVYEVAPRLALLDDQGEPANIAYPYFHSLTVKELQKHQQRLDELLHRIEKLESHAR